MIRMVSFEIQVQSQDFFSLTPFLLYTPGMSYFGEYISYFPKLKQSISNTRCLIHLCFWQSHFLPLITSYPLIYPWHVILWRIYFVFSQIKALNFKYSMPYSLVLLAISFSSSHQKPNSKSILLSFSLCTCFTRYDIKHYFHRKTHLISRLT